MGVYIVVRLPDWKKKTAFVLGLFLLLGIALLFHRWAYRSLQTEQMWTVPQLAEAIKQGDVQRLIFGGDVLNAETGTGARVLIRDPREDSLIKSLREEGVSEETLSQIEIVSSPVELFGWARELNTVCRGAVVLLLLSVGVLGLSKTLQRAS